METPSLLTNLFQSNLKSILSIFENNGVILEFSDPNQIKKSISQISDIISQNTFLYKMYLNVFGMNYIVNIKNKKITHSQCFVDGIHSIKDTCFGFFYNLHVKKLSSISEIVNLNSTSICLEWEGSQIFSEDKFVGISYSLPKKVRILDDELKNFLKSVQLDEFLGDVLDKFALNYIAFNHSTLSKIAVIFSDVNCIKFFPPTYENIEFLIQYFNYFADGLSVEFDVINTRVNSIETPLLSIEEFFEHIKVMSSYGCFDKESLDHLNQVVIPPHIENVIVKFGWDCEGKIDYNFVFYTEETQHINKVLMAVDSL